MGATFPRIKNWIDEDLLPADLNAEFNNILNNLTPAGVDDYSVNVAQMQAMTSPGTVGSESLATSLAGEIERIRYQLDAIIGKTHWYEAPSRSLEAGTADLGFYIPFNGADTFEVWCDTIRRGVISNAISYSSDDFVQGDLDTTAKFGNYAWNIGTGNHLAVVGTPKRRNEGTISCHFYNIGASEHIAYNPSLGIELYTDSGGRLGAKITQRQTATENSKTTATITGTNVITGTSSWKHALLKYSLNGIGGASTDLLGLKLDGVAEGTQLTGQSYKLGTGDGGVWFFGSRRNDPTWSKYSAMKVRPDVEASDAWSFTGDTAAVSILEDGVLQVQTDTTNHQAFFSKTNNVDMSSMVVEFKFRFKATDAVQRHGTLNSGEDEQPPIKIAIRDDSMDRSLLIGLDRYMLQMTASNAITNGANTSAWMIDSSNWHTYRVHLTGATDPVASLYIDGVKVGSITCDVSDTTAADVISFGDQTGSGSTGHQSTSQWEYFAYYSGVLANGGAPVYAGTSGKLDEIAFITEALNDTALETSLATVRVSTVLGRDLPKRNFWKYHASFVPPTLAAVQSTTSATAQLLWTHYMPSDGLTTFAVHWAGKFSTSTTGEAFKVALSTGEEHLVDFDKLVVAGGMLGGGWTSVGNTGLGTGGSIALGGRRTLKPGVNTFRAYYESDGTRTATFFAHGEFHAIPEAES